MYAVVKQSLGSDLSISKLREIAHNWLSIHFDKNLWAPVDEESGPQNFKDYLHTVLNCAFGDQYTLTALGSVLKFDYTILRADGSVCQNDTGNIQRVFLAFLPRAEHYMLLEVRNITMIMILSKKLLFN
jgi:hypothetical protein